MRTAHLGQVWDFDFVEECCNPDTLPLAPNVSMSPLSATDASRAWSSLFEAKAPASNEVQENHETSCCAPNDQKIKEPTNSSVNEYVLELDQIKKYFLELE